MKRLITLGVVSVFLFANPQAEQECKDAGGTFVDGVCLSQNISSQPSPQEQKRDKIIKELAGRSIKVNGYFAFYGNWSDNDPDNPYKWVYYASDGSFFAKLDGMDPNTGYLKWTPLNDYFKSFSYKNGNIIVGKALEENKITQELAGRSIKVNGYFAFYGNWSDNDPDNPYKWVYYASDGSFFAKLDGMDPNTGYLKWTPLNDYFKSFSYQNGNIVVGNSAFECENDAFPGLCKQ